MHKPHCCTCFRRRYIGRVTHFACAIALLDFLREFSARPDAAERSVHDPLGPVVPAFLRERDLGVAPRAERAAWVQNKYVWVLKQLIPLLAVRVAWILAGRRMGVILVQGAQGTPRDLGTRVGGHTKERVLGGP